MSTSRPRPLLCLLNVGILASLVACGGEAELPSVDAESQGASVADADSEEGSSPPGAGESSDRGEAPVVPTSAHPALERPLDPLRDIQEVRELKDQGRYQEALERIEEVLRVAPRHEEAGILCLQIEELLGIRGGGISSGRQLSQEGRLRHEEVLRREAEEYHRLGREALDRGDTVEAMRYFERVGDHIRWSGNLGWGDLPERNAAALQAARDGSRRPR